MKDIIIKDKKTMTLIIITILILLVSLIGATYAYFTAVGVNTSQTSLEVYTASHDQVSYMGTNVYLDVNATNMQESKGSNDYKSEVSKDVGTLKLELKIGILGGSNTCTYDIIYTPINEGKIKPFEKSETNVEGLKEYVVRLKRDLEGEATTAKGETEKEIDLTGSAPITLISGASLTVEGIDSEGAALWEIKPVFYNLAYKQDDNSNKAFGGVVTIANLECRNDIND